MNALNHGVSLDVRPWIRTALAVCGLWIATAGITAAELTVTTVQGDGLAVPLDLCVTHRPTSDYRCEVAAEDGSGVRFADLPAGTYVVTLAGDPMWQSDPVEIEIDAGDHHTAKIEVTTRIDFATLSSGYDGFWQLRFEQLSSWSGGKTLVIGGFKSGKATAWLEVPRSTDPPIKIELTSVERDRFVDTLERSRLFDGGYAGTDTMATDGPFNTLRVTHKGATVILVTSGNPTFAVGPRRELLRSLDELRRRLEGRGVGP